jgi:predicted lipopolysaccharide heptosyltransferase III
MKSALVVQLKRLGDLVLTTPALSLLRKHYPTAKITLLIDRHSRALAPALTGVDQIWVYRGTKSLWVDLLRTRFDLCLDFTGNDRSAFISLLSRAPKRIGFSFLAKRSVRSWAYTQLVLSPVREKHTVDHYLDLVRSLGAFKSEVEISLHLPEQINHSLFCLKRELSLPSRYFVLHPGSARAEKYWVAARWAEVIAYAHERFKIACVITGGRDPGELQHVDDILLKSSDRSAIFNLAGKIDLLLAAALIEHAFFFLGVDTVTAHFAAAFRRPSITLFGPTNPFHWHPRHSRAVVLRAGLPGPIENFDPLQKRAPMSELSTETVIRAMEVLLKGER